MSTSPGLIPFEKQWAVLLTSYKQDGTPVGTPVSIVVDGDHAYVRTYATSGKAKRMRNNPEIELAPCTARGKPTGPAIKARVRLLDPGSEESQHASKMLLHEHPFMHGALVPIAHKVMRDKTLHYEVRPL
ncbi:MULTISPECIES: PPOX class F420-dependent oxidoreductase [unclassified Streptomyces]|uniref:PPOX class F420-dependent oxidoreductase n=1 Tax=unclassified Streptomyces TaxID=2593676 RepID=UPI0022568801|nr:MULTISPECIES: PPOX class F420-dependent oxidoreductase [unclassified Streptomyces]MCX4584555.1 PPOX class F420-dependent oxidoreductase [Streptomyces sp. NBC_01481]WSY68822.1 PPOX class F420-dependent oxidoreductase [Streptomyces sp. NBC_00885]WSY76292.1 PPOX class F420-dependent oxidoreductase [Streptomyces sp. NBC_00879]HET6352978.1 PPOX class F420-dependent oxidoreductase [Streptomyces sp.]